MLITSPQVYSQKHIVTLRPTMFIAGGISNCWDWQKPAVERLLAGTDLILFNPRRDGWNMEDSAEESKKQIRWEHTHLKQSDYILFWFPQETLCPITLLELGKYMMTDKALVVGTHPNYGRRLDVIEQLQLERPDVTVWSDLKEMIEAFIKDYDYQIKL
jgi:Nucleoside 2-deoxyribosyltransferase like